MPDSLHRDALRRTQPDHGAHRVEYRLPHCDGKAQGRQDTGILQQAADLVLPQSEGRRMAKYVPHERGDAEGIVLPDTAGTQYVPQLGADQFLHICGGYAPAPVVLVRPGAAQQGRLVLYSRPAKALRQRDGAERPAPQRGKRFVLLAPLPAVRLKSGDAAGHPCKARELPPLGQPFGIVPQAQPPAAQSEADAPLAPYVVYGHHAAVGEALGPVLQREGALPPIRPDLPRGELTAGNTI